MRCAYCRHRLDVAGDDETRSVEVRRTPLCRPAGRDVIENAATACALCAEAKGLLTDAEFRLVMGDPVGRKQLVEQVQDTLNASRWVA